MLIANAEEKFMIYNLWALTNYIMLFRCVITIRVCNSFAVKRIEFIMETIYDPYLKQKTELESGYRVRKRRCIFSDDQLIVNFNNNLVSSIFKLDCLSQKPAILRGIKRLNRVFLLVCVKYLLGSISLT